jgi:hypothetical protein
VVLALADKAAQSRVSHGTFLDIGCF